MIRKIISYGIIFYYLWKYTPGLIEPIEDYIRRI